MKLFPLTAIALLTVQALDMLLARYVKPLMHALS